jgi:hypothetical protein
MHAPRRFLASAVIALVVLACAGCASGPAGWQPTWQPGNLQPLVVGWQQFFRVQWDATRYNGQALVDGYITNVWGFAALNVQLLVTGYDATGRQVGQVVAWGPSEIDFGARVYFNVPVPTAATYDVAIFAWTWVQTGNGGAIR